MLYSRYRISDYQKTMGFMFSLIVLGILMVLAVKAYMPMIETAKFIHVAGEPVMTARLDAALYHALEGRWPENHKQAEVYGIGRMSSNVKPESFFKAVIENGAVHCVFSEELDDKTVSLRPVISTLDPLGPVHWICGPVESSGIWVVHGKDRTDVPLNHIPKTLR